MATPSDKERYLSDFRRFQAKRRAEPQWMQPIRDAAIHRFGEIGFPTLRDEDWRYTNVSRLVGVPFRPAFEIGDPPSIDSAAVRARCLVEPCAARLVFVNGRFLPERSHTGAVRGLEARRLADVLASDPTIAEQHLTKHASFDRNGFTALSTAFLEDGAFVSVADGAVLDEPIELHFLASARGGEVVAHPRVLVLCGRDTQATIVESYASLEDGATLTNAVTEVTLGEGARLHHVRIAREGRQASHVATTQVVQGRDSRYEARSIVLHEAFLRHNLGVRFAAEGAECLLDGLYLAGGDGFVDNHTEIDHAAAHTTSRELYKGILGGRSKAVFNGKVIVRPNAQKSDAQQTNKNLLVSDHAEIDTKPELQISADDVKCTHGAAIGQLDPDALFYLKSRGLGDESGRRLLVYGFANEMIRRIGDEGIATTLERAMVERLEGLLGEGR
jgi:Fe-S cluster assembly protein SufD